MTAPVPLFQDLSSNQSSVEVSSLCMECHEQGITRFLLTRIPHFKDIIISAFECPHCGLRNNEVQSATAIAEKGLKQSCIVSSPEDLDRQVVVSEYASIIVEEISLEIPSRNGKGYLSTIEGILKKVAQDLNLNQNERQSNDPELYEKISKLLERIKNIMTCKESCTFTIDDPSGNSYIENLRAPLPDPKLKLVHYRQSHEQLLSMGIQPAEEENIEPEDVYSFRTNCSSCATPCDTRMRLIEIPHFREVIIMATACEACGYKSNEVKSGGAISDKGKRIILKLTSPEDLNRDILKSETCELSIPELDLHLTTGFLGGRFTTVEGFLRQVHDDLKVKEPFLAGDSAGKEKSAIFRDLLDKLQKVCNAEIQCTLSLDDPLANSYLQNLYAPEPDPNMIVELYERTFEQNEALGLNDISVD